MQTIDHNLPWGSNGIDGTGPLVWKNLIELDSSHLNNILMCCGCTINEQYKLSIYDILEKRGVTPVYNITNAESSVINNAFFTRRDVLLRNHCA